MIQVQRLVTGKKNAVLWIRFNPLDGSGVKNENITRFTYALVESDDMPISEQDAFIENSNFQQQHSQAQQENPFMQQLGLMQRTMQNTENEQTSFMIIQKEWTKGR